MDIKSLYREIVNEHNLHPSHKHDLDKPTMVLNGVNPSCGDDINLQLQIKDGIIEDAAFNGSGCAVSQLCADFMGMIRGTATQEQKEALDESASLEAVSHMPARVKCATLGWRTMKEMVESLLQNGTVDGRVSANNSEVCGACARTDCERK